MIQRIQNGEVQGILCWQINRLSRNPVDSGTIQWLLQDGIIKSILTPTQEYRPEDNALVLSIEAGQANQFLRDLSVNVKRGMRGKRERGWFPHVAPVGYLNDKAEHTVIKDPHRFSLIREAWDMMLTGRYSVREILNHLNNVRSFRTVKRKKSGGYPLAISGLYSIFTNQFYTGFFLFNGELFMGKHDPMVTVEEFDHVQTLLGRKGKPRPKKHDFAFRGPIRCGECGCAVTAQIVRKVIKSTGKVKVFTYYRCTRRKADVLCTQSKMVTEKELECQIEESVRKITIMPEFREWALESLQEDHGQEVERHQKAYEMQNATLEDLQKQLDNLATMRMKDQIDEERYNRMSKELESQLTRASQRNSTEQQVQHWLEIAEKEFVELPELSMT